MPVNTTLSELKTTSTYLSASIMFGEAGSTAVEEAGEQIDKVGTLSKSQNAQDRPKASIDAFELLYSSCRQARINTTAPRPKLTKHHLGSRSGTAGVKKDDVGGSRGCEERQMSTKARFSALSCSSTKFGTLQDDSKPSENDPRQPRSPRKRYNTPRHYKREGVSTTSRRLKPTKTDPEVELERKEKGEGSEGVPRGLGFARDSAFLGSSETQFSTGPSLLNAFYHSSNALVCGNDRQPTERSGESKRRGITLGGLAALGARKGRILLEIERKEGCRISSLVSRKRFGTSKTRRRRTKKGRNYIETQFGEREVRRSTGVMGWGGLDGLSCGCTNVKSVKNSLQYEVNDYVPDVSAAETYETRQFTYSLTSRVPLSAIPY
ncbi:hypothetical protein NMY22_g1686 [Coprinellus aureogranulatus]|nr:hypothetical protein NMY22_g1686 [Coprinellus aureogranulatus]